MTGIAVVAFNSSRAAFPDNMTIFRQNFCESVPVIRVEYTLFQMLHFVVQSSERCSITTTEYPGDSSPCAAIHRLDEPFLSFFLPI